jgi:hypothetical protein
VFVVGDVMVWEGVESRALRFGAILNNWWRSVKVNWLWIKLESRG